MNMSYCRFENTLRDLNDCLIHISDDDLSNEENRSRKRLIETAMDIIIEALDSNQINESEVASYLGFEFDYGKEDE